MNTDEEMLNELKVMNRWLRILAIPTLREKLVAEVGSAEMKRVYQASDGSSIREVAKAAGVGKTTVQRQWQAWAAHGLVEPSGVEGRFQKIVDLKEVGVEA